MPTGVGPQFAANCRVGNHEADRIGDFLRANQTAELCKRKYVFLKELGASSARHGRVGEAGMDDPTANAIKHGLFHQCGGRSFQASFRGGVRDLPLVALRRNRPDKDNGPLHFFGGLPTLQAALPTVFSDAPTISIAQ